MYKNIITKPTENIKKKGEEGEEVKKVVQIG
jgi:hypothetical protein